MAPNVHVFSEEIKSAIDHKKNQLLRFAVLQMQKGQEQTADSLKKGAGGKDDKLKDSAGKRGGKSKQKESLKKKGTKGGLQAGVSFGGSADQAAL